MISIIVPCFNEQESLPFFYEAAKKALADLGEPYELLFVNDGSKDGTLTVLRGLSEKDNAVRYLSFSRNFGKEAAMYAGVKESRGDYVALMDADLQHPPAMLREMFLAIRDEGYDIAAARRVSRKNEPPIRSFLARRFYRIINKISNAEFVDGASDFRMFSRQVVNAMLELNEYNRFSKGIFGWVGFSTKWIPYENVERVAGETKWSFWKLFRYAIDGIINFSSAPLTVASWGGISMTLASFLILAFIVIRKLLFGDPVQGWASMVCIVIFIGGVQLFCLGITGQYIAKIHLETKRRPHYIIAETSETRGKRNGNI